ncbi:MAG: hypothetical protein WC272_08405 [Sulfurimonas sp.]|jgi:hypothetical protein
MKKIVLSTIAALAVSATSLSASQQFYVDDKGQVFTTSGPDRIAIENKEAPVFMKGTKLEFSGTHYFGLTSVQPDLTGTSVDNSTGFELRRNYLQVKAYFNDKDFFRVTLDTTKELGSSTSYADIYAKYAYLYLDGILPYTGVEIGIVHRPWIDYEEHNSWHYRSINKVALEQKTNTTDSGPDLVNSADLGFNLKTKTDMFSSEIGMFNGEGYHADKAAANQENSTDLSLEWRLTGHLIGSGTKLGKNDRTKVSYLNVSTYGLISQNHKDNDIVVGDKSEYDRSIYGIHAVYNQPLFLIAAQYYIANDDAQNTALTGAVSKDYMGWSLNAELRPMTDWTILGRYDVSDIDKTTYTSGVGATAKDQDMKQILLGAAYKYNKNVSFIASGKHITDDAKTWTALTLADAKEKNVYMLTTEVKW